MGLCRVAAALNRLGDSQAAALERVDDFPAVDRALIALNIALLHVVGDLLAIYRVLRKVLERMAPLAVFVRRHGGSAHDLAVRQQVDDNGIRPAVSGSAVIPLLLNRDVCLGDIDKGANIGCYILPNRCVGHFVGLLAVQIGDIAARTLCDGIRVALLQAMDGHNIVGFDGDRELIGSSSGCITDTMAHGRLTALLVPYHHVFRGLVDGKCHIKRESKVFVQAKGFLREEDGL